jgi:hypothetical protein
MEHWLGVTNHGALIMGYWHAIAVKVGWGKIKDVMIGPGSLVAAMVIHVLEMSNPILVCIWEGSRITASAIISNLKWMKGSCEECIYHARVVRCSPKIKESLPNNITLSEKKDVFNYMGECLTSSSPRLGTLWHFAHSAHVESQEFVLSIHG